MQALPMWESVLLSAFAVLMVFWMGPGIKRSMERSKQAKPDWPGFLLPMLVVVIFVVFLVAMV